MPNELDDWIGTAVAPTLRDHGYRGGPRRFRRRVPGFVAGIQFQGSSGNVLGLWRFTINVGVTHLGIAGMTGAENVDHWHVSGRVSAKRDRDLWWDLGVDSDGLPSSRRRSGSWKRHRSAQRPPERGSRRTPKRSRPPGRSLAGGHDPRRAEVTAPRAG